MFPSPASNCLSAIILTALVSLSAPAAAAGENNSGPAAMGWHQHDTDSDLIYFFWPRDRNCNKQIVTILVTPRNGNDSYWIHGFWVSTGKDEYQIKRPTGASWTVDFNMLNRVEFEGVRARYIHTQANNVALQYNPEYQQLLYERNMLYLNAATEFGRSLGQCTLD